MLIKVIYPSDANSGTETGCEFNVDVPYDPNPFMMLEVAWRLTNRVEEEDNERMDGYAKQCGVEGIRSAMVGDIFVIADSYYVVDSIGFKEVNKGFADVWRTLGTRERMMGSRNLKHWKFG